MVDGIIRLSENRFLRLFLVGLAFLSLQTTLFNELRPFGVSLEVMLLVAASSGLARGSHEGAIAGFILGLMYDMVLTTPLGLCAAVFALVGYLAGYVHSFVHDPTWWSQMLLGAGASVAGMVLMPLAFTLTGVAGILTPRMLLIAVVVASFNGPLSYPVAKVCNWALRETPVAR